MTLLGRKSQSLVLLRSCFAAATRSVAVAALAVASGCSSASSYGTFIPIRAAEGARWVSAETVESYGCDAAALVCSADGGRLSERLCRCSAVP
jgi:hypothetical protein